jgi:hypothetical protein
VKDEDRVPKPEVTEKIVKGVVAGAAIVSAGINAPALAIVGTIVGLIGTSAHRRLEDWLEILAVRISHLEDRLEELFENESFVTTVYTATQIAMRTHQEEKRQALCNAVLNSASESAPDDTLQAIYLNFIDQLTPLHFSLLSLIQNPKEWIDRQGKAWNPSWATKSNIEDLLLKTFSNYIENKNFYLVLLNDLRSKGLIQMRTSSFLDTQTNISDLAMTPLGTGFIKFISEPIPCENADNI